MSHFSSVDTKITDLECLKLALTDLKMTFTEAQVGENVFVKGYHGQLEKAELKIKAGQKYEIGIRRTVHGTYEFVADWWGVETTKGITEQQLVNQVMQRYAYHKVMKEVKKYNYQVEEEVKENKIYVRLTQY